MITELTVVLPAFNEGDMVREAIERYADALAPLGLAYEILVIDDGSRDGTHAVAEEAARRFPQVRVLRNNANQGQVLTLLRGFTEARGEIVTHNGVDLPFDPDGTARLVEKHRAGADVVVVERSGRMAYSLFRKVASWCHLALVRLLLGSPYTDHNFVQSYRREVLRGIRVETRGVSTVTTELILKARLLGCRVERMLADYQPRRAGVSSITLYKIAHTAVELLRLWSALHSMPPKGRPHGHYRRR